MELDEYSQDLQFIAEHPLNTQPLKIDVVIIKKPRDVAIEKNIASIFRKENIVEYKSPEDYVSIDDFYKVYGYACVYKSLNKADIKDLTLTFVESRYPRELLAHLRGVRGYTVEEKWPGVYIVTGDILPIQIVNSRKLSEDENVWLKDLYNKLEPPEKQRVTTEIYRLGKDKAARLQAYLYVITRAYKKSLLEAGKMRSRELTMDELWDELLVDIGFTERWEARFQEKRSLEIARKMKKMGDPIEKIQAITDLPVETIEQIQIAD